MLDHISIQVSDLARALAFYEKALAPLGASVLMNLSAEVSGGRKVVGLGRNGKPEFWIGEGEATSPGIHLAFAAPDRTIVDAFYGAAIAAGGIDNGPPGLRPEYHAGYYGAFVLDPDGHNIEAVCHRPE
ncbi:MAG TPA: VOC family protein [Afifellaceae bacterium]|nr:VOC family protein [Afifellaceae bacterium]